MPKGRKFGQSYFHLRVYIVIPVHNEERTIALTLQSLISQTITPKQLVIVNDNSSDHTESIVMDFVNRVDWISLVNSESDDIHLPGTKVVNAFNKGYETLDSNYDVICKFDADLIFPENYIETLINIFSSNPKIGVAGGLLYIQKKGQWLYENIASKNHVRGPIKAYRKACFEDIKGLKPCIGWDTIDVYLAQYYGWIVCTDKSMRVSHLKPRGQHYSKRSKLLDGERWFNMRYGSILTLIASLKVAIKAKQPTLLFNSIKGYYKAKAEKKTPYVTIEEGQFIRRLLWKNIFNRIF